MSRILSAFLTSSQLKPIDAEAANAGADGHLSEGLRAASNRSLATVPLGSGLTSLSVELRSAASSIT
jgi:hypothetical protein